MTKPKPTKRTDAEYRQLGKMLEDLFLERTSSTPRLLWYNFMRGIAYGLGIFLAGTVVIALLLWFLGLFDQVPVVGRFVQAVMNSVQSPF